MILFFHTSFVNLIHQLVFIRGCLLVARLLLLFAGKLAVLFLEFLFCPQGAKVLQMFMWILNPRQVFDLSQGGLREA